LIKYLVLGNEFVKVLKECIVVSLQDSKGLVALEKLGLP